MVVEIGLLIVALALTAACAVFVAAEFSLTTAERGAIQRAADAGERGAATALKAVDRLTFQLSGAQLGITLSSLVIGMIAEPSVAGLLHGPLGAVGLSDRTAEVTAVLLGVLLSTVVLMVAGELVPKNWAISRPVAVAKVVAGPQYYFSAAFSPLIGHLNDAANWFVRRRGLEPAEHLAGARTPQELIALARHSAREGAIAHDAAELFIRSLRLGELSAQNVMTPRVDVRALDVRATGAEVADLTRVTGLSRFLIYRDNADDIVGVVHIKDVLAVPVELRTSTSVSELMTEPLFVPESLTVDHLLDRLRGNETLAVVVDEFGGTAGIATFEDIVEEIVGDVSDEHDNETLAVLLLDPTEDNRPRWRADGITRIDELAVLGLAGLEGPYDTLAGLLAFRLDRIPNPGDRIEIDGWTMDVEAVAHHVAERVTITGPGEATTDDQSDGTSEQPR
jgi:CBS domain containing-hemolysin-like protein